jgi:hypothetical protein
MSGFGFGEEVRRYAALGLPARSRCPGRKNARRSSSARAPASETAPPARGPSLHPAEPRLSRFVMLRQE